MQCRLHSEFYFKFEHFGTNNLLPYILVIYFNVTFFHTLEGERRGGAPLDSLFNNILST